MATLKQLLGNDERFFELLEASAQEACVSIRALKEMLAAPDAARSLDRFAESRRKDKAITHQIGELLCTTVVTGLEREDIEALSNTLYKIPKTIEKVAERFLTAPQFAAGVDFSRQMNLIEQATDTVLSMARRLKSGMRPEAAREHNQKLQQLEGEADKVMVEMLRALYASPMEGKQVVFVKDLLELLERAADRCRDAGMVISRIVLKNS